MFRMNRWRNKSVICAVLCACCLLVMAHDLGVVDAHRKVACDFIVTNTSSVVWKPVGTRASCACLSVTLPQNVNELKPGERLPVKVVFDPKGMEGPVEKVVQVEFTPKRTIVHSIKADVRLWLGLKPLDAAFGVIRRSETDRTIKINLAGSEKDTARIVSVDPPPHPVFSVSMLPDGRGLEVGFAERNMTLGFFSELWKVKTSDAEIPEMDLPISARVTDGFCVSPQVLTLGWDEAVCSRVVLLRPERKRSVFKVLSAETKPRKWGDVRIVARPLNGWQIAIDNIDPAQVRQFSKRPYLEVKTDLPGDATVEIPLRVVR